MSKQFLKFWYDKERKNTFIYLNKDNIRFIQLIGHAIDPTIEKHEIIIYTNILDEDNNFKIFELEFENVNSLSKNGENYNDFLDMLDDLNL